MSFNRTIILFLILFMLSCVKYSFRGALPSYLKTLYIEDFENNTQYPDVREEFMQKVTESFIKDNSLQIIGNKNSADLILSGSITSIKRRPISITQQEQVQEFQMVVTIKAECLNTQTQKPLWAGNLERYGIIPGDALRDDIDRANSEAIDQIVEDILTKTIAAW